MANIIDINRQRGRDDKPEQVEVQPDGMPRLEPAHDPELVADAMRAGVPVAQAEAQAGVGSQRPVTEMGNDVPPAGGSVIGTGNVFTNRVDVMDEYRRAYDAARMARQNNGVINEDTVREALAELQKYRSGKAALEDRIVDNEEYYRMQHWGKQRKTKLGVRYLRNTGWLFTAVANKAADFMDNYPEATVAPREQSDEAAAQQLTSILPVVMEHNHYKHVYKHTVLDAVKNGTGIQQIVWDPQAANGMGDIAIRRVDPLNIFWEPGVEDIQNSANLFTVELQRNDDIVAQHPEIPDLRDHLSSPGMAVTQYLYNENIDNSDKSYVVNWYYKRRENGHSVLHYCRFVNDVVLFASENDPQYAEGWYKHGLYPFVFFTLYPEVGTPFGFGEIDIGRDTQEDLDEMNAEIMRNTKQALRRRYLSRMNGGINEEEYADLTRDIVHVEGTIDELSFKEITTSPISGAYLEIFREKINEMKETTANRDVTQGGTGGTQTASGIAALQESGNKVSRSMISSAYESFRQVCELVIELIRQFYDVPRSFRIIGPNGEAQYMMMDNRMLQSREMPGEFGVAAYQSAEPIFDVTVKAFKQNPWSRQQQNQDALSLYGQGFFAPQNYITALACLEVMDLENGDKLKRVISANGEMWQQAQQMAMAQMIRDRSAGMTAGAQEEQPTQQPGGQQTARTGGNSGQTVFDKAAAQAQAGTSPRG